PSSTRRRAGLPRPCETASRFAARRPRNEYGALPASTLRQPPSLRSCVTTRISRYSRFAIISPRPDEARTRRRSLAGRTIRRHISDVAVVPAGCERRLSGPLLDAPLRRRLRPASATADELSPLS